MLSCGGRGRGGRSSGRGRRRGDSASSSSSSSSSSLYEGGRGGGRRGRGRGRGGDVGQGGGGQYVQAQLPTEALSNLIIADVLPNFSSIWVGQYQHERCIDRFEITSYGIIFRWDETIITHE